MFSTNQTIALELTRRSMSIDVKPVRNPLTPVQCHLIHTGLSDCTAVQLDKQAACDLVNEYRTLWTLRGKVHHYVIMRSNRWPYSVSIDTVPDDICVFSHTLEDLYERFVQAGVAIFLAGWIRAIHHTEGSK